MDTFNELGLPLKIAGTGPELDKLKAKAKANVEILGFVDEKRLVELYANCKGFLFPQLEDAGIVPLEAMACGRPVIALNRGGSLDTMIDGKTGALFEAQTLKGLSEAVQKFEKMTFDPKFIRKHAEAFDVEHFKKKIKDYVEREWGLFKKH